MTIRASRDGSGRVPCVGRAGTVVPLAVVLLLASVVQGRAQPSADIRARLDDYRSGRFDAAVRPLVEAPNAEAMRDALVRAADDWIMAEPSEVVTRRLVAASFALEVAHARLRRDNSSTIILLNWATRQFSKAPPTAAEARWLLAAVALVERGSRDGSITLSNVGGGARWGEEFLARASQRFPDEPRLRLARVVWRASHGRPQSVERDLERLLGEPLVHADALVQLGYLHAQGRDYDGALRRAHQAIEVASSPATRYIAAYLSGYCYEVTRRPTEAMTAYRLALGAVPHAQSASLALAQLLMRDNQGDEALELIDASLTERPQGDDPWRLFTYGGYIHWAQRLSELREVLP